MNVGPLTERPFPLQQGDLDFLCSLYAVVNLLHLHGRAATIPEAGAHFTRIMGKLPSLKWDLPRFVTEGVNPTGDLLELLGVAGFKGLVLPVRELNELRVTEPGVLVFLKSRDGSFDHYTIVTEVRSTGDLVLFDSFGFDVIECQAGAYTLRGVPIRLVKAWRVELWRDSTPWAPPSSRQHDP